MFRSQVVTDIISPGAGVWGCDMTHLTRPWPLTSDVFTSSAFLHRPFGPHLFYYGGNWKLESIAADVLYPPLFLNCSIGIPSMMLLCGAGALPMAVWDFLLQSTIRPSTAAERDITHEHSISALVCFFILFHRHILNFDITFSYTGFIHKVQYEQRERNQQESPQREGASEDRGACSVTI